MLQFNFQTLFEENHYKSQKMGLKIQTNYSLFINIDQNVIYIEMEFLNYLTKYAKNFCCTNI